jgi:ATP-dependent Lhr-like helicase
MVGVAGVLREGNFYENADPKVEKSAELVRGYGKKAVIALSVYGVGPQTASKILRMMRQDEKQFFMDLIDAQKNFIKNKRFWSI